MMGDVLRAIGVRMFLWHRTLLRGTDPKLADVSFEAYFFDGPRFDASVDPRFL